MARLARTLSIGVPIALIAAATLTPAPPPPVPLTAEETCRECQGLTLANAILNVALYAPLGIGLAFSNWSWLRAMALAAGLSAGIEATQALLPGRFSAGSDILFNLLGAGIGFGLLRTVGAWSRPPAALGGRLALCAAIAVVGVIAVTGYLFGPALPSTAYFGQWTAAPGGTGPPPGKVLQVTLDGRPLPSRQLSRSAEVRVALIEGRLLRVRFEVGSERPPLVPIFSIADDQQRRILLVGADRDDLAFWYRMRASAIGLDQPELRVFDALRPAAARDTVEIVSYRNSRGYCFGIVHREECGLGYGVGMGWALLFYPEFIPALGRTLAQFAWMALLGFPIGFWMCRGWTSAVAVSLVLAGLVWMPGIAGLQPTSPLEYSGVLSGVATGLLLASRLRRRPGGGATQPVAPLRS